MIRARRSRILTVLLAGTLMLAGCRGADNGTTTPRSISTSRPCAPDILDGRQEPVRLVLWYQFLGLVDRFNRTHSTVRIDPELQGASYSELFDAYRRGIPSRQLPDIIIMGDKYARFLVDSKTLLPAQICFDQTGSTADLDDAVVNYYKVNGVIYPASASVSVPVTYYNKSHFRRAGLDPARPPATLAEVRRYAEQLKQAGIDKPIS
jgi:sn-glycerol 3-phosphate transport system substrate-binding protein